MKIVEWCLFIIFIFIQIFDYYSTRKILLNGGIEKNKMMLWFMKKVGVIPALSITKSFVFLYSFLLIYLFPFILVNIIIFSCLIIFYGIILFKYNYKALIEGSK